MVRVKVRVTYCIHKLTLVLHFATESHCSNYLCSLCMRHAVCATGKMHGMAVCLLWAPVPRVKVSLTDNNDVYSLPMHNYAKQ